MAITPPAPPDKAAAFIAAAPDAGAAPKDQPERRRTMKGKQEQISHSLPPDLLDAVDAWGAKNGFKRAQAINLAIRQLLQDGITLKGNDQ